MEQNLKLIKNNINQIVWIRAPHTGYPLPSNPVPWKIWNLCEYMIDEAKIDKEKQKV